MSNGHTSPLGKLVQELTSVMGSATGEVSNGLSSLATLFGGIGGFARGQTDVGSGGGDFLELVAGSAAEETGIDTGTMRTILQSALVNHTPPSDLTNNVELQDALVSGVSEALSRRGMVGISPDEVKAAVDLLETGEAANDLDRLASIAVGLAPNAAGAVIGDVHTLPEWLVNGTLVKGLLGDLRRDAGLLTKVGDLAGGQQHVSVPSDTLQALYELNGVRTVAGTAYDLLGIKTVALALVIYANIHGAQIDLGTVEAVRQSILNVNAPDIGPLLTEGAAYMKSRYGGDEAGALLKKLVGV